MHSLRARLVLSHILPLLVIIPLIGAALLYILETQVLLNSLSNELMRQAQAVADTASGQAALWSDAGRAQSFVNEYERVLPARVVFLDERGQQLAAASRVGQPPASQQIESLQLEKALSGEPVLWLNRWRYVATSFFNYTPEAEVAGALVPVKDDDERVLGVVRLTSQIAHIQAFFLPLRYSVIGILLVGLVVSVVVGWRLASHLGQPLQRVTRAIYGLAGGQTITSLPEQGPEEIRLLSFAVNILVARLHAQERSRRRLLANLVHELGRPLGALRSGIQALMGGADRDADLRHELLVGMDGEVGSLQRLLEDLSRLYDQALGTVELECKPVALSEWLPRLLRPWQHLAQDKELHWQVTIPTNLPMLEIDADRLGQAVGNLLSNATKYTPPKGTIFVSAGRQNESVYIRIGDTGPGIDPNEQIRLFTPFYRGHAAGRFPQGMGLGLAIARDLVIAHNGRLELDSTPRQGSQFTIWLPLHRQQTPSSGVDPSA